MKRRLLALITALVFCMALLPGALAAGFSNDVAAMNAAAQSCFKLMAYSNGSAFASGSGFIAYTNNLLVTNYHVIEGADKIVAISDSGEEYTITQVLMADKTWDYAVLVFPQGGTPLTPATGDPVRGSRCVAIGSPRGMKNTFSEGMISGTYTEDDITYVQFNAPISSGSSGGALFNDEGEVIGITSWVIVDTGNTATQNLNYAIDIRDVTAAYAIHKGDTPVELSRSFAIADPSYRDDWRVGDVIYVEGVSVSDLGVKVTGDFDVYSYDGGIFMQKGDTRIKVSIHDSENLGLLGKGLGLLDRFTNMTDRALKLYAETEFNRDFNRDEFQHPTISGGFECAMTSAFTGEYEGIEKLCAMGMVHEESTYLQMTASSTSGSAADLEATLKLAMDCIVGN